MEQVEAQVQTELAEAQAPMAPLARMELQVQTELAEARVRMELQV